MGTAASTIKLAEAPIQLAGTHQQPHYGLQRHSSRQPTAGRGTAAGAQQLAEAQQQARQLAACSGTSNKYTTAATALQLARAQQPAHYSMQGHSSKHTSACRGTAAGTQQLTFHRCKLQWCLQQQ
jgi:hypothetical protein